MPIEQRNQNEYVMAAQSAAMAGQNLLLAAHDAGLGACWMCAPLFCPEVVRDALQSARRLAAAGVDHARLPAETREKTRRPLEIECAVAIDVAKHGRRWSAASAARSWRTGWRKFCRRGA